MTVAELTDEGLVIETQQEILDGITTAQRDPEKGIDPNLNNTPLSPLHVANAIVAERYRDLAELQLATYGAMYPSQAQGQSLANGSQLTGTLKRGLTKSRVTVVVNLDPDVTLVAGDAAHVFGRPLDRYQVPTDVSVTNTGDDPADFLLELEATVAGSSTRANSGTLTIIATPKDGWNSVVNPLDSIPGKEVETDTELRIRRVRELNSKAGATYDRMRAQLGLIKDVVEVEIIENSSILWFNGVPPKAFEALVLGGLDQTIIDTIWANKPHGIEPFGSTSGTALDLSGNPHPVKFSRPAEVNLYVQVTVKRGRGYPGDEVVKEAVVDAGAEYGISSLVVYQKIRCSPLHINGVSDVPQCKIGRALNAMGESNLQMGNREKPRFDTSRVTVTAIT